MAFVVRTKRGRYEVRESRSTAAGPRSRTLASFTEFGDEVVEKAQARAEKPLDTTALRAAAARAGAPVRGSALDDAARETLRRYTTGEALDPKLRTLLLDALNRGGHYEPSARDRVEGIVHEPPHPEVSDAARSASEWVGAGLAERGVVLRELMELGDALPARRRPERIGFPRLESTRP